MKKILLLLVMLSLTSCDGTKNTFGNIKDKLNKLDKAKCFDEETNTIKVGCKKN